MSMSVRFHGEPATHLTLAALEALGLPHASTTRHCPGIAHPSELASPIGRETAALLAPHGLDLGRVAFLRRLVAALSKNARLVNVDWDEKTEFGPSPKRRVPRARFLRDAKRAGLRLVADRKLLPHQYFLVMRRAR